MAALRDDFIRNLLAPLGEEQLGPLSPECRLVQVGGRMSRADWERLSAFLRPRPDVTLGITGTDTATDLEFPQYLPDHPRLRIALPLLTSLDGLRHLSREMLELVVAGTKARLSLRPLQRLENLETLGIVGHTKDLEVIGSLSRLRSLSLISMTLPNLSAFLPLTQLTSLTVGLGGTKNLSELSRTGRLRNVVVWRVRGLTDLSVLGDLASLESLELESLPRVAELPSFGALRQLRRAFLVGLGVSDLTPVSEAPALAELIFVDRRSGSSPDIALPFVGHRALKKATFSLGGARKDEQVRGLLRLPPVYDT